MWDLGGYLRCGLGQLRQRLADDLELPLNGRTDQLIGRWPASTILAAVLRHGGDKAKSRHEAGFFGRAKCVQARLAKRRRVATPLSAAIAIRAKEVGSGTPLAPPGVLQPPPPVFGVPV